MDMKSRISHNTAKRQKGSQTDPGFQDLVENSMMGMSLLENGVFCYVNPEQQRILGDYANIARIQELEVIQRDQLKFQQICHRIEQQQPLTSDTEIRFYPSEAERQKKELRYVVIRTSLVNYLGRSMILLNMADISHSKRLEQLTLLQGKMESLGHISMGIAHEIRSPLSGINLLVEGVRNHLEEPNAAEDIGDMLDQIQKASAKIEAVVKRVLDFARPSDPQVKPQNPNEAIEAAFDLSATMLRKAEIDHTLNLQPDLPRLYLDLHLIEQVVLNLITNAVNAMQEAGRVKRLSISSKKEGNDIAILVEDSGPGIDPSIRKKIFDPFFTTRDGGSGIGLSICQRIVTDHGGVIFIADSQLGGAKIHIRLPIDKRQFKR